MRGSIIKIQDTIEMAKNAVITFDDTKIEHVVNKAFELGIDPVDLIEKGFVEGMREMDDRFEDGKISILQIFAASQTMRLGINMLKPKLSTDNKDLCFFGNIAVSA